MPCMLKVVIKYMSRSVSYTGNIQEYTGKQVWLVMRLFQFSEVLGLKLPLVAGISTRVIEPLKT